MNIDPQALRTAEPFNVLFPIKPHTLDAVTASMRVIGFDDAEPIVTWNRVVIDGHTRLEAAKAALLSHVSIVERDFQDEDEALEYAIRRQRDRRNMTDADILRCVGVLDERRTKAEAGAMRGQLASNDASSIPEGKSAKKTAELLGTSESKVERARQVLDHAPEETKEAVLSGETSINAAATKIREDRKPKPKPEPKPVKVDSAEVERLTARIAELEESHAESLALIDEMRMDLEAAHRILDAEGMFEQFQKEIHRAHALATSYQTRNNGLMNHNKSLARDVKRYATKAERLEKKLQGLDVEPEPLDVRPPVDNDPDWFSREEEKGA